MYREVMRFVRRLLRKAENVAKAISRMPRKLDEDRILAAKLLVAQMRRDGVYPSLRQAEFRVFSQFGDDGIIQYLLHHVAPVPTVFVEFGVEDYAESNTRFLAVSDNWRGLVMDSDRRNIERIQADALYWRHDVTAVRAFVDRDNIDALIGGSGFSGEIGLLSIDIDGNDYWVWQRLSAVDPVVVVVEYNAVFGGERSVVIPYDPSFDRRTAHRSQLYWGASLPALVRLGEEKGYGFVGCNSAGNNAYFVRRDRLAALKPCSVRDGFVTSRIRESRGPDGKLTFLAGEARRAAIADQVVWDVEREAPVRVADL
jgi:hypothetical protein